MTEFTTRYGEKEVVIKPFNVKMSPLNDPGWLQWSPNECIKLSSWSFSILKLLWPFLFLLYRKNLSGQNTNTRFLFK